VRVALGIGRGRLVAQHILESTALAVLASGLGIAIAHLGVRALHSIKPADMAFMDRIAVDAQSMAFAVLVALTCVVVFGLWPAIQALSVGALQSLRAGVRTKERRGSLRARWSLIVAEVALSFAMLVASILLIRSVAGMQSVDPGFDADGLVVVQVKMPEWRLSGDAATSAWRRAEEAVGRLPGVRDVTMSSGVPTRAGVYFGTLRVEGTDVDPDRASEPFFGSAVSPGYFRALRQPVLAGRGFTEEDIRDERQVYVLGEAAALELFPDGDAVGSRMTLGDDFSEIVGVVADIPARGLDHDEPSRQIYTPLHSAFLESYLVVRVEASLATVAPRIRTVLRDIEADATVNIQSMRSVMRESIAVQRFTTMLLIALATVASLLSAIGLYGVVSQVFARRTREIGIRMSLGATGSDVLGMVLRSGALAAAVGMALGTATALAGGAVLRSQLFGIEPRDPVSFGFAAGLLGVVTLLAVYLPAKKAASVDPVRAIRAE
jgi:predicted permease